MNTNFGVYRKQRETHMLLVVPTHVASCAAPSFYLQTLTRPHSLAPKTLFWSNMTRISCTLFQQQTLLITCNMPGQQTTGTVSYCWVKTVQLHSSDSITQGVLPVWNTIWNQNIPEICPFQTGRDRKQTAFLPTQPLGSPPWRWSGSPGGGSLTCSSAAQLRHVCSFLTRSLVKPPQSYGSLKLPPAW